MFNRQALRSGHHLQRTQRLATLFPRATPANLPARLQIHGLDRRHSSAIHQSSVGALRFCNHRLFQIHLKPIVNNKSARIANVAILMALRGSRSPWKHTYSYPHQRLWRLVSSHNRRMKPQKIYQTSLEVTTNQPVIMCFCNTRVCVTLDPPGERQVVLIDSPVAGYRDVILFGMIRLCF